MFQYRGTGLLIPQSEHAKIVLHIAENWGNKNFGEIPKHREEFLKGVIIHDRAFGINDNFEIGGEKQKYTIDERIDIIQKGFELHHSNIIVDVTVLHHLSQLCTEQDFLSSIGNQIDEYIQKKIQQESLNKEYHQDLQTILWLCDNASFLFCLGKNASITLPVVDNFLNSTQQYINIEIKGNNIYLEPFPLKEEIEGTIIGYSAKGYPDQLKAQKIKYKVIPGKK